MTPILSLTNKHRLQTSPQSFSHRDTQWKGGQSDGESVEKPCRVSRKSRERDRQKDHVSPAETFVKTLTPTDVGRKV